MFLSDFHIHSLFSADSESKIESICENAILKGISEICITDHIDLTSHGVDGNWTFDIEKQTKAVDEAAKKFEGKLTVRTGVELGQINHNMDLAKRSAALCRDYIIGSVHDLREGRYIHLIDYDKIVVDAFFAEYLDEAEEIIDTNIANSLGHIDYPMRYMSPEIVDKFDIESHAEHFARLFNKLIYRGMSLEFNTAKFISRPEIIKKMRWILKLYRDCKGEAVTLGSDAHTPVKVGFYAFEAAEILKDLGYRYTATFKDKKCVFNKID